MNYEFTILLRFLGIILRVRFLYGFLRTQVRGCGFLSGFSPFAFAVYSNFTGEIVRVYVGLNKYIRGCVNLEKQKSQGKAVEVTVNSKEEKS
jgi:hypothetical protein